MMIVKHISFPTPEENILFDETLFVAADKKDGPEVLRFWEANNPFVVLGRIGKLDDDVHAEVVRENGVPVLRRSSGGGTVVQGAGCLNFTLIVRKDRDSKMHDLRKSYQYLLNFVQAALKKQGIDSCFEPVSDLALAENGKKFSGNAQRRGRNFVLHHGTVLYNFDLSIIERLLKMPKDQPQYRKSRSHLDFVTNISIDTDAFKRDLATELSAKSEGNSLTAVDMELFGAILEQKGSDVRIL